MEKGYVPLMGHLKVYKVGVNGVRELIHEHKNTIGSLMQTNLAAVLISRSVEYGVDAIAWGSFKVAGGTFIDSSWAGTTSSGTQGALIQSAVGSNQAKFSGTFSFSSTKNINFFQLGRGYTAAGAGVSALFTTIYNYDNSLLTGSTALTYNSGEALILDWITQVGS